MKKYAVVIVVIVLVAVGYFGYQQYKNSPQVLTGQKQSAEAFKGTIQGLLNTGKNVTCTVKNLDETGGNAVIYVSGDKIREDITSTLEGKTTNTYFIQKDGYSYIWSSDNKQGMKLKLDAEDKKELEEQTKNLNLDKEVGMTCAPWVVDGGKFVVPSDVEFTDFTQMVNEAKKQTEGIKNETQKAPAIDKSVCDSIEDANAKAACVQSLSQ
ncbi:hypothetical protein M1307_03115 [Patescibacteria group bacterium]|nr:hypothetical protein [Patescibacteria group bacterium]